MLPICRCRCCGQEEEGREGGSQPSKEAHSLAPRIRPLSLPPPPLYYERDISKERDLSTRTACERRRDGRGRTDGRTRTDYAREREREQRYIWRRRWPRRKWKTEETGSKEGERERGEGEGRSAGLSFLSAGIAHMTRPSGGGRRGWQRGSRWSGGL